MASYNQTGATGGTHDAASDSAAQLGRDATDAAQNISRKATAAVEQAGEMAQEKLDAMTEYVRKNPLQATAIAAGIGFVFALIARR